MSESGFEVGGVFYAFPTAFRLGDPPLVREVTGMSWAEFVEALGEETGDPTVSAGMVAVAVWQKNPDWRRDRVVRFVERLDMDKLDFVGGDDAEAAGDPPGGATPQETGAASETSTSEPNATPASSSAPILVTGGAPA